MPLKWVLHLKFVERYSLHPVVFPGFLRLQNFIPLLLSSLGSGSLALTGRLSSQPWLAAAVVGMMAGTAADRWGASAYCLHHSHGCWPQEAHSSAVQGFVPSTMYSISDDLSNSWTAK